ncbi:MAG: hypothetical protein K6F88_06945 [Ruminococcus sp.]|nr:hypothetical protein [Ruminococcus sp.]
MENFTYFGITFEKFDILDFTDDFLAGVRANFFNSNFEPQSDRCVQYIGENKYFFMYNIVKGQALSWKSNKNDELYQNAETVNSDTYRVNTYNKSGRIFKREYFNFEHIWIKSEYLFKVGDYPEYVLYPSVIDDNPVIVKIHNAFETNVKSYLYPKTEVPEDGDYSLLAYSDKGFVYFNSVPNDKFISKTLIHDTSVSNLGGFDFDAVDFNLNRNLNTTFDISTAEYLTEENGNPVYVETNAPFNEVKSEFDEKHDDEDIKVFDNQDEEPDITIESSGESYRYYGQLSESRKRDGYGRTVTSDGLTAYEGEYSDDKRDGFGAFYYKDGRINYVGNWIKNSRNGFGVGFRGSDGSVHIGKWSNNQPEGVGARFDKDGNFIFLGSYFDGKKQGKGITLDDDGSFIVSEFKDDKVIASYKIDDLLNNLSDE